MWIDSFSHAIINHVNPQSSDHTPLMLNISRHDQKGSKPFRFFNYQCDHQDFLKVVSEAWKVNTRGIGLQGLWYKMNNVKVALKNLHSKEFKGITSRIKE